MKPIWVTLVAVITLMACSKTDDSKSAESDKKLIGTWTYTEQYMSTGGPGTWSPAIPAGQNITFHKNGKFSASENFLQGAKRFEFVDSMQVKISPVEGPSGYVVMGYELSEGDNVLQLYPLEPARCIEGCSSKFVRVETKP